jgi:hypothetical protein
MNTNSVIVPTFINPKEEKQESGEKEGLCSHTCIFPDNSQIIKEGKEIANEYWDALSPSAKLHFARFRRDKNREILGIIGAHLKTIRQKRRYVREEKIIEEGKIEEVNEKIPTT